MKWWHWVAIGLLTVAMMCGLLLILVFAPGVQRRAFLSAVEAPGRTVEVDRVNAGLGGVEIGGLRWAEAGLTIGVREIRARFPLLDALGSGPVIVDQLTMLGLTADLSEQAGAHLPEPADPAAHVPRGGSDPVGESALYLPPVLTLQRLLVEGEVTVAGGGPTNAVVAFSLRGEALTPGAAKRVRWTGRVIGTSSRGAAERSEAGGDFEVRSSTETAGDAGGASLQRLLRQITEETMASADRARPQ